MYERLKEELELKGISQEDVAETLNLAQPTVSNKLTGKTQWKLGECRKIMKMLRTKASIEEIFSER